MATLTFSRNRPIQEKIDLIVFIGTSHRLAYTKLEAKISLFLNTYFKGKHKQLTERISIFAYPNLPIITQTKNPT